MPDKCVHSSCLLHALTSDEKFLTLVGRPNFFTTWQLSTERRASEAKCLCLHTSAANASSPAYFLFLSFFFFSGKVGSTASSEMMSMAFSGCGASLPKVNCSTVSGGGLGGCGGAAAAYAAAAVA